MSKTIQIGASLTADFQENTWTFEMQDDFSIVAGKFALVPLELYYKDILEALICAKALFESLGVKTSDEIGGNYVKKIYDAIQKIQE